MSCTANQMLARQLKEEGYCRFDDPLEGTKYGRWYAELTNSSYFGTNGVPFCAMGQSYCFDDMGQDFPGFPTASCPEVLRAVLKSGHIVSRADAKPCDVLLFDWDGNDNPDHIGICTVNYPGRSGGKMQTFEFNTTINGRSGSVGHRVRDYSTIIKVIRPAYKGGSSGSNMAGKLIVDGVWGRATTLKLQEIVGAPYKDGVISRQNADHRSKLKGCGTGWEWVAGGEEPGSQTIELLQKAWGMPKSKRDGLMGPETANYMIAYYMKHGSGATLKDGKLDNPSLTIKAMQRRANEGKI